MALVSIKMISGEDLEPYYTFLMRVCPSIVPKVRSEVEKRIQWLLSPLMRIRKRRFVSRCVARRWADRRWSPYTWVGQRRLLRDFEDLQAETLEFVTKRNEEASN